MHSTLSSKPTHYTPVFSLALALMVILVMMLTNSTLFSIASLFVGDDLTYDNPNFIAFSILLSLLVSYLLLVKCTFPYFRRVFLPMLTIQTRWLIISLVVGILFAVFASYLQTLFPPEEGLNTVITTAYQGSGFSQLLILVCVILLAPFFEEYLFRGIVLDSFKRRFGANLSILFSSVFFTFFHLFEYHQYWLAFFAIFCLAIMLAFIRHKSESMLNPILLHATYNLTIMLLSSN